ncbi:xylulokinase [Aestuariimicrobium soli]|uniref:xylulokinase n=1 Tax=Aestuariimicrobium soli TaxID=2035834 RepID=UPI003EB81B12
MVPRRLVAGVDSSTQACKVLVCDAATGEVVREGRATHPEGTEVHPDDWWAALVDAIAQAGGLDDVEALSVAGQQHGLVVLDDTGAVLRPALLWNDTRSAGAADDLIDDLGGPQAWARAVGSVPVASLTVAKLRWLADHEPEHAARAAAVCLPHDWLTWKLLGSSALTDLTTDRSDASGTGWYDAASARGDRYRRDLVGLALRDPRAGERIVLPRVLGVSESAGPAVALPGSTRGPVPGHGGPLLAAGAGDNAAAALGLGLQPGHTSVSLGTSAVVAAVSSTPAHDASGLVTGFADATGAFLPLACTLNGSRVLDGACSLLGVDHDELSRLALSAEPGAGGLVLVPWFEGERTPNLPTATASLHGMTAASMTRENYARASVEGLLCSVATGLEALRDQGVTIERVSLIGGAAASPAVRELAAEVWGLPVDLPDPAEHVARGAARQAAWMLGQTPTPPPWRVTGSGSSTPDDRALTRGATLRARYREVADRQAATFTAGGH